MYIKRVSIALFAGWASRTYFSDNGSTAIEIALKMAFRKFTFDHGTLSDLLNDDSTQRHSQLMVGMLILVLLLIDRLHIIDLLSIFFL